MASEDAMTFRGSYGIPKKLWHSEGSHGIQETRTRLLFLSAPFEKTPRRADFRPITGRAAVVQRAGKTRSSGRPKRIRTQGMFAAQAIIPASRRWTAKAAVCPASIRSPRPDAAGLKPAGAAHRSLFRPSVQPKIHINGAVPAERLA